MVEENVEPESEAPLMTLAAHYPDGGAGSVNYVLLAGDSSVFR